MPAPAGDPAGIIGPGASWRGRTRCRRAPDRDAHRRGLGRCHAPASRPAAYHRLLTTGCLPPAAYHRLLTTGCLPPAAYHRLLTTGCLPPAAYHRLLTEEVDGGVSRLVVAPVRGGPELGRHQRPSRSSGIPAGLRYSLRSAGGRSSASHCSSSPPGGALLHRRVARHFG